MKDVSDSGYWSKGQTYVPHDGPCKGHEVRVINPEVTMMQKAVVTDGPEKGKLVQAMLPSVFVRCTECFKSWAFPENVRMPVDEDAE